MFLCNIITAIVFQPFLLDYYVIYILSEKSVRLVVNLWPTKKKKTNQKEITFNCVFVRIKCFTNDLWSL